MVARHTGLLEGQSETLHEVISLVLIHNRLLAELEPEGSALAELYNQVAADHKMLTELKSEVSSLTIRVNAMITNDDGKSKDSRPNNPDQIEILEKLEQMRKKIQETDHMIFEVKEKIRRMDEESVNDREARDKNMRRLRDRVESLADRLNAGPGGQGRRNRL
jgi:DNA repair exonuclease SbcCD ATPase subunit